MPKAQAPCVSTQETLRADVGIDVRTPSWVLVVVAPEGVRVVPLREGMTVDIGRGDDAAIKVSDLRMSRLHVRLHGGPPFRIEDLGSVNGTLVRGEKLEAGEARSISPGDAIEVGATMLVVRPVADSEPKSNRPDRDKPVLGEQMAAVLTLADRAALSNISVLLLGETGVGKDVVAERIHRASPRAEAPFLRLNCAALAPTLLESELFGHERGAFTGAAKAKVGLLESAARGTVFLDEIGDLPLELQVKLLLVLERHEVMPVGATRPRPIDVRFIAATNRPLSDEVANGAFRADLYYRLNGLTLTVPALRERRTEVEGLARRFANEAARSIGHPEPELTSDALDALRAHPWPGNVRELRTVVERAVLLGDGGPIGARDVVLAPSERIQSKSDPERDAIVEALASCGGNQSRAAERLGIARNTLISRIEKYGLARPIAARR